MLCPAHLENLKIIMFGERTLFLLHPTIKTHVGIKNLHIRIGLYLDLGEVEGRGDF